jgi:glycosyltransferase involved in cell wall biosynthesis
MNLLKVVFCTDGIFPHQIGGMQRHSRLLLESLAAFDVELTVIHPHEGVQVFNDELRIKEFAIRGIDKKKNYLKESKAYSKRVYDVLKELPENTIIYNQGFAVWYGIEEFSERLITNPHGLEPFQAITRQDRLKSVPFQLVFKQIFKKSRLTVSLGGRLTTILMKILPQDKITILPNAVAERKPYSFKEKPDSQEKICLFFLARFAKNKGIHILMKAIEELNNEGYKDKLHFKLGGKGPLFQKYEEGNRPDNVELLGFVSDEELTQLYQEADVFVFPTLFEGMPTVVLEAMSNYLPIIVSDTGATSELVDGENGFIIEPDNIEMLKDAIRKYFNMSAKEKDRMSDSSFVKCMDNFTWKSTAKKHVAVFNAIHEELTLVANKS